MTEFIFDIAQNFRQYLASSSDISAISMSRNYRLSTYVIGSREVQTLSALVV